MIKAKIHPIEFAPLSLLELGFTTTTIYFFDYLIIHPIIIEMGREYWMRTSLNKRPPMEGLFIRVGDGGLTVLTEPVHDPHLTSSFGLVAIRSSSSNPSREVRRHFTRLRTRKNRPTGRIF